MEQIISFIEQYGLTVTIIATLVILIIGILKQLNLFSKITNKELLKGIYYLLNVSLSFLITCLYLIILKLPFEGYLALSITQVSATTTLYALYENFGLRKLFKELLKALIHKLQGNPKFEKLFKDLNVTEDTIDKLLTDKKD